MKWFRYYSSALNDPKVQRLPGTLFKHWINILSIANEYEPRGSLPPVKDIAFALRIKTARCETIVDSLRTAELLDMDSSGTLRVHGWDRRQPKSDNVAERVEAYRRRQNTASEPVATGNVTLHETVQPRSRIEEVEEDIDIEREENISLSGKDSYIVEDAAERVAAPAAAASSGWTDGEVKQIAKRLAGRLKIINPDIGGMTAVLQQHPCAPSYLEAEAAKCFEWYDGKHRKVTIRLFDNWLAKAEARREVERQQQLHALNGHSSNGKSEILNGQQQQLPASASAARPAEPDIAYAYNLKQAQQAAATRAKLVS